MALIEYGFKCINKKCKQKEFTDMLERDGDHKTNCPLCHQPAQRVYSLSGISVGFRAGFDVGLGQYVDTQQQRDNILAENGFRKLGC